MQVEKARKLLLTIPRERWQEVASASPELLAFATQGSPRQRPGERGPGGDQIHRWLVTPPQSNRTLMSGLDVFRSGILSLLRAQGLLAGGDVNDANGAELEADDPDLESLLLATSERFGHAVAAVVLVADSAQREAVNSDLMGGASLMELVAHLPEPQVMASTTDDADHSEYQSEEELLMDPDEEEMTEDIPEVGNSEQLRAADEAPGVADELRRAHDEAQQAAQSIAAAVAEGIPVREDTVHTLHGWNESLRESAARASRLTGLEVDPALSQIEAALSEYLARQASKAAQEAERTERADKITRLQQEIAAIETSLEGLPSDVAEAVLPGLEERRTQLELLLSADSSTPTETLTAQRVPATMNHVEDPQVGTEMVNGGDLEAESVQTEPSVPAVSTPDVTSGQASELDLTSADIEPECSDEEADALGHHKSDPELSEHEFSKAIREFARDRRFGEAFWVAEAFNPGGPLAAGLRRLSLAFASNTSEEAAVVQSELYSDWEAGLFDVDGSAAFIAAVAAARTELSTGWLFGNSSGRTSVESWQSLLDEVEAACRARYTHSRGEVAGPSSSPQALAREAAQLHVELENRQMRFAPAKQVLRRLVTKGQPLATALASVQSWSAGDGDAVAILQDFIRDYSDQRRVGRLIDSTHDDIKRARASKSVIDGYARRELQDSVQRVVDVAMSAVGQAVASEGATRVFDSPRSSVVQAARQVLADPVVDEVECEAVRALAEWILDPDPLPGPVGGRTLLAASIPMCTIPRDADQWPQVSFADPLEVLSCLTQPHPPEELVSSYLEHGNLAMARLCTDTFPLTSRLPDNVGGQFAARKIDAIEAIRSECDRARFQVPLRPDDESNLEGEIQSLGAIEPERCDLLDQRVRGVRQSIERARQRAVARITGRLSERSGASALDRDRILALTRVGDLSTADEFLGFLEQGEPLPAAPANEEGAFEAFQSALLALPPDDEKVGPIARALGLRENDEAIASMLKSLELVLNSASWRGSDKVPRELTGAMQLLGLQVNSKIPMLRVSGVTHRGVSIAKVVGTPIDRSLVPGLGTRATRYSIIVAHQRRSPGELLAIAKLADPGGAHIILANWLMTPEDRRMALKQSRETKVTALVIDAAACGYVAARAPRSFATLQEISLPYAVFSHYSPNVAGDVPDEVFVGRSEQIAEIASPTGSLYVYGGRQLGKSAVLRKVQRDFDNGQDRIAIYVDLKATGVGEYMEPEHLWSVLLDELRSRNVMPNSAKTAKPENVVRAVRDWLNEEPARRMLLLLDEADAFLEGENAERHIKGRTVRFPNILPLKDLMDSSNRRFKVVFAGLHQVQRFSSISNTPLAHGGRDIAIGPLEQGAALRLVEDPLRHLGYRLESPELAWRLLATTNYQPGLVQIVCDQLIKDLHRAPLAAEAPPVVVRAGDVQAVLENRGVRDQIATRFRLTISLEDRYKVIALVLAHHSLVDDFTRDYSQEFLVGECASFWPEGFSSMDSRTFVRYLEEMEGLGVLLTRDGRTKIRSVNVIRMLGTPEAIENELMEGNFALPQQYNPRFTRRHLAGLTPESHSPLTEDQLATLLPMNPPPEGQVSIVVGCDLTNIERVVPALHAVAHERAIEIRTVAADGVDAALSDRQRSPLIVDAVTLEDSDYFNDITKRLLRQAQAVNQRSIVVVGASLASSVSEMNLPGIPRLRVEPLGLWTSESLRSWVELPFESKADRARVIDVTGGWPSLVEPLIAEMRKGESLTSAINNLEAALVAPTKEKSLLSRVLLVQEPAGRVLRTWATWVDVGAPGEVHEVAEVAELSLPDTQKVIDSWTNLGLIADTAEGPVLNSLFHRLGLRLASA